MRQDEAKLEPMANETMQGVFIGFHVHAGGVWSGDYYVAEHSPFKQDGEVVNSKVKSSW